MYTILEKAMQNDEPRPKSVGAAVADLLRDAILTREYVDGERLPELPLCEKYGVSRIPLREAYQILASEGLIVSMEPVQDRQSRTIVDKKSHAVRSAPGSSPVHSTTRPRIFLPPPDAKLCLSRGSLDYNTA